jgi:hypothetical protein
VQAFLPYSNFKQSAQCLDRSRLGKQRVEVLQMLKALTGETKGWANHSATRMWRGHTNALVLYGLAVCDEWILRGYKDTCYEKIKSYFDHANTKDMPSWLGNEALHASHRSNLLRKDKEFYSQYGWTEPDDLPYVWPVPLA